MKSNAQIDVLVISGRKDFLKTAGLHERLRPNGHSSSRDEFYFALAMRDRRFIGMVMTKMASNHSWPFKITAGVLNRLPVRMKNLRADHAHGRIELKTLMHRFGPRGVEHGVLIEYNYALNGGRLR